MNNQKDANISTLKLVLVIIATEFGFSNIVTGYNQMGYASIIWYVLCAIIYLFPLAMIFAEYSGAIEQDHGGFYTWLINSLGEKWAFIGTFCWVGLWVINLLQNVSGLGVNLSGAIFGKDISETWHLGSLDSNEVAALMGIVFIIAATYFATKGVKQIAMTATIAGVVSLSVIAIFILASVIIFFINGHLAQPIHGMNTFIKSPNPAFQSPVAIMSFIIYAMFAFGGMESSSGFIDKMKNPQRDFPKAMIWVAIVMTTLYIVGIFVCGLATNWLKVMGNPNVNLYNNGFYLMGNLGVGLAHAFGWSTATGEIISGTLVRVLSIGSLLPLIGLVVVLIYSPVKGLIAGSSKDLWPKKIAKFNKHDMPAGAMWVECGVIVVALIFISLTGNSGQQFYQIITDMGNIGSVFPYYFVVIGFIFFKKRTDLKRGVVFFHSMGTTYLATIVLLIAMTFAVLMNLISPLMSHQYSTAFWTFAGPVLFVLVSILMYYVGIHHRAKRMIIDNEDYEQNN
ncbi:glutamate/gamma-aminobutyrate family transporter YjeM [Philodulcilactobacillus myokoensis]|uniref:Glutamate/gamma-aminobutyrate family transporter YjeM n=1 Tax=Philodulcilactobacillus myokoensis TaxID=2929573 RepID=A0A9W6ES12_9LACO|nr:glutamate/gamma-aminobutyrate family transporter YjeM [Philodulcilactobacillus myokoensis]GLB46117.1 glutamate/gamma-aminobutyrate family transporter YjeM [Philodulcilactobacillus myokoensis]